MKQRQVLVLSNLYPGRISATFGIFVKNQVEALRKKGLHVAVAAVKDPRIGKVYVLKKYLLWALHVMFQFLLKGRRYDVVHAHYVFPTGLFALWFKRVFGTRMIVTAHGGDIDKMARKTGWIRKLTGSILNEADSVIAVGEGLKRDIVEQFGVSEAKVSVINMGVNREVFTPIDQHDARSKTSVDQEVPLVLYVGNILKQKGLDELILAFEQLKKTFPEAELHLLGAPKDPQYQAGLERQAAEREIGGVHFHGARPQAEVAVWLAAADVLALPSYIEGFGLVALEAMSCHTPVVGSEVGGLTHLLSDNCGIPVQPKNVSSLSQGLSDVLSDRHLQESLVRNGEHRAQMNDQNRMIDRIYDLYFPTKVKIDEG
ncbi:MAG TPA: glycosyltransferase [Bacillales bacterium]|nr:glycosyltransferase [Bacillales bacterium]